MLKFRTILGCVALAILGCFSLAMGSLAFAEPRELFLQAADAVTSYGSDSAKHEAALACGFGCSSQLTVTGLLARESNGFRLNELVSASSEVTKGTIGVGTGAVTVG